MVSVVDRVVLVGNSAAQYAMSGGCVVKVVRGEVKSVMRQV